MENVLTLVTEDQMEKELVSDLGNTLHVNEYNIIIKLLVDEWYKQRRLPNFGKWLRIQMITFTFG